VTETGDEQLTRTAPARRRPLAERTLNGAVRALLRSPLHGVVSRRLLLITVVGRRTGTVYTHPVGYVVDDDGAVLVGSAAGWRRNLRAGEPVRLRLRGHERLASAEVIRDEGTAAVLYRTILRRNPVHGRFAGIHAAADGAPDPEDLRRALGRGAAVVRLRLDNQGEGR
jgi:deazaflavin-dependent oxidoreductase (nitroreductase family)